MKKHAAHGPHARARALRQDMTEHEKRVWRILRSGQIKGHKFRRQVPIGCYIADFVCHKARLILEIDGGQHDRSSCREAERTEFLQNEGYRLLRFWNNEILENLDGIHRTIADALATSPVPKPPPSWGEAFQSQLLSSTKREERQQDWRLECRRGPAARAGLCWDAHFHLGDAVDQV
jgi:very-short-patch-repair endonuclease